MSTNVPRYASLYVRVSKAASESNMSAEGMMKDCEALAESHGFIVVGRHFDNGVSGAVRDRREFLAWLADAEQGRASVLIAWHGDRLTREGVNAAALVLDVIEGKDTKTGKVVREPARLLTVDDRLDSDDAEGFRLRFVLQAEIGRAERERMKARAKAAQRRLREQGRWSGRPPYGCRLVDNPDGPGKVLAVEESEAAYLREAADRLLRGASLLSTARWLNEAGSKPRRAREWSPTALDDCLKAAAKRGLIFTPTQARDLLAVVDKPKGAPRRIGPPKYILSRGGAVCSGCGGPLTVNHRAGRPTYRCPAAANGASCPARVSIATEGVDEVIEAEYLKRYGPFAHVVERVTVTSAANVDAALADYEAAQAALSAELTAEALERAKAAKDALEAAEAAPQTREVVLEPTGRTILEEWRAQDIAGRQAMLRGVLAAPVMVLPPPHRGRITVTPEWTLSRLLIPWRGEEDQWAPMVQENAQGRLVHAPRSA